MEHHPAMV
jgi:hypothetical protein